MAINLVGIDKILFGSDYPLLPPENYFSEMQKSGLSRKQISQICGLNAQRLFDL
jgi:predicted TIM-barrel fold metal-dependent hydrolase